MRFWDSSAIIPLLLVEERSADARALLRADDIIVAAAITPVEIVAALWRRRHRNLLDAEAHTRADDRFAAISAEWIEVEDLRAVVSAACDVLSRHELRAADATQLGAAITAARGLPALDFVTFDVKLAAAARAEGFYVLT